MRKHDNPHTWYKPCRFMPLHRHGASGFPRQLLGLSSTVQEIQELPWAPLQLQPYPEPVYHGYFRPLGREAEVICRTVLTIFYICVLKEHPGLLRGNDIFWGTPSLHCWSGSHQECREFPSFPMENCEHRPGCEGRKRAIQPFRNLPWV